MLLLILVIFLAGCNIVRTSEHITGLKTDKELYHSGEIIHMTYSIYSKVNLENVKVRFYGINATKYRLDQIKLVNITIGNNTINFDYVAPKCYGCAGIKPGMYNISAEVSYSNRTLTTVSKEIEIKQ